MQRNKLSIHIETGNIYYDNFDTGESIYFFFTAQQNYTKKILSEEFRFFDRYEDYIMNYLTQIESKAMMCLICFLTKIKTFFSVQSVFSTISNINKTYCNS